MIKTWPRCVVCGAPATLVDHIIPITQDPTRAFDIRHLQPMDDRCQRTKTQAIDAPGQQSTNYRADRSGQADKRPAAMRKWAELVVTTGQQLSVIGHPSALVKDSRRQFVGSIAC